METLPTPTSPMVVPPASYEDLRDVVHRKYDSVASYAVSLGHFLLNPDEVDEYGRANAAVIPFAEQLLAEAVADYETLNDELKRRFDAMRLSGWIS